MGHYTTTDSVLIPDMDWYNEIWEAWEAALTHHQAESEDQSYMDPDGCPTEMAVLKRFWRDHQAESEPVADWNNRRTDSFDGWINELLTLVDSCHRELPGHFRRAVEIIVRGLREYRACPPPAAQAPESEPVEYQFQDHDGKWRPFMNEEHRRNTEEAGYRIRALYLGPQPAAQVPEGWRPVPIINLQNLLRLIDPEPVRLPNGKTMVFKNPDAADTLSQMSAEVRAMLAVAPSIAEKRELTHYVVANDEEGIEFYVRVKEPISEEYAKSMMHEHINDAINGGVEGAERWVVRAVYGLRRPEPPGEQ
jgi:hypothetical protein